MFFHLRSVFYSVIFLGGLEIISFNRNAVFYIAAVLLLVSLWGSRKIGGRWIFSIVPAVFSFSSIGLLYLIDSLLEKQVFIALSALMFYLAMLGIYRLGDYLKDQTARGMVAASATTTLFFFFTAAYGIYLNFLIPLWVLMVVYLLATTVVSYQYFRTIQMSDARMPWIYSILLGMVMAEFAWVMNFWPFGYLTTGVITLIFYYVLWDLAQSYFLKLLSKRRVVANMILFSFLTALVLASSRWLPAV